MATMCARWVVKSALFSLFEGWPKPHFCCFIFEKSFCGLEIVIQEFQKRSLKRVHVQLSGGHSDAIEDSIQAINEQE